MIEQLPRPFIIMGDFNSHDEIWGSKKTEKKGKIIEPLLNKHHLSIYNNRPNTYPHPAKGTYSVIDLICDPNLFLDYDWKVHDDTCGSDHFPILLQNKTNKLNKRTLSWNLKKANWDEFKTSCLSELIPKAKKDPPTQKPKKQRGRLTVFYQYTTKHSRKTYTEKLHLTKTQ